MSAIDGSYKPLCKKNPQTCKVGPGPVTDATHSPIKHYCRTIYFCPKKGTILTETNTASPQFQKKTHFIRTVKSG